MIVKRRKLVEKLNSENHRKLRKSPSKIQMNHISGCQINLLKMNFAHYFSQSKKANCDSLQLMPGLLWWLRRWSICLQCGRPRFNPSVRKISWRGKWQPTPVFLTWKSHGRRNLVDYSLWGRKESDTTEWLHLHSLSPLIGFSLYLLTPASKTSPTWT